MTEGKTDWSNDRTYAPRVSALSAGKGNHGRPAVAEPIRIIKDLTAQLAAIAEEFGGRAAAIATLAVNSADGQPDDQEARLTLVRSLIEERRARCRFLPKQLFHEPAWDMLLALYLSWHEGQTLFIKTLVATSSAPITTSQRWIDHMAKLGLITRVTNPDDQRRIQVSLSESGLRAPDEYLAKCDRQP